MLLFTLTACQKAEVTLQPRHDPDGIHFEIASKGCNGLSHLTVWERGANTPLWVANLRYFNGPDIKYGEPPANSGNPYFIPQLYPVKGHPEPIPVARDILVNIEYQYDENFTASVGHRIFGFRLEADGSVSEVDPRVSYGEIPNIPKPSNSAHEKNQ
jgi:hypothetical protein